MAASIQLLGVPQVVLQDGTAVVLRGHKAWGLLAYLVTHQGAVSRLHLGRLLFEDAEDPLAALRWNLTELRRALGPASLRGEAIALDRDSVASIDLDVLRRGGSPRDRGGPQEWHRPVAHPGTGTDSGGGRRRRAASLYPYGAT